MVQAQCPHHRPRDREDASTAERYLKQLAKSDGKREGDDLDGSSSKKQHVASADVIMHVGTDTYPVPEEEFICPVYDEDDGEVLDLA